MRGGKQADRTAPRIRPGSASSDEAGVPAPRRYWAVLALSFGVLLAVQQTNVVNIALPMIAADFGLPPSSAVWIATASQLAILASLFPLAVLGERLGYRRVYIYGLAVSVAASLACALSESLPQLVAARVIQGVGVSAVMAVNLALFRFVFPKRQLGLAIGYSTFIVAVSSTAGPSVAGGILSVAGWPWLFLLDLPIGLLALGIGIATLPDTPKSRRRLDVTGAFLIAATFILLIMSIDSIGRSVSGPVSGVLALSFALAGFALFRHQSKRADAMLPFDLLRIPQLGLSASNSVLCYIVQGMCFVILPFQFHDVLGFSPALVGFGMSPWPLGVALAAPLGGWLASRYPSSLLITIGLSILLCGLMAMIGLPPQPELMDIAWRMAVCGIGFGLFQSPNSVAIMSSGPMERSASASAIQSAGRLLGQTMGVAVAALVLSMHHADPAYPALIIAAALALLAAILNGARLVRTLRGR